MGRMLIDRGANVNPVDKLGMTPLLCAASSNFGDARMIELLRKAGATPTRATRTAGQPSSWHASMDIRH